MREIRHRTTGQVLFRVSGPMLRQACMYRANLAGADLRKAQMQRASLEFADLSGADLSGANLWGAFLRGACLAGADLTGADLSFADLRGARLAGALYDDRTRWPVFFNARRRGCIRQEPPSELVPASSPGGRGDELAPAG